MVVGKTSFTIALSDIFSQFSEVQILHTVFPEVNTLPCIISSPLRVDSTPSFSLYLDDNKHVRYKDFGDSSSGGLIDLLSAYWHCTFKQTLTNIGKLLVDNKQVTLKSKQIKMLSRKEANLFSQLQVVIRPWKDYDYQYWASYGITKKWLKYAEIYPISYKIITKKDSVTNKNHKYVFPADKYAYCFVNRKEGNLSLKIYQPFNTKGYKWYSKADKSIIELWTKIPEYGDTLVLCSSMKDALCLSCNLNIPTLALQGEGYSMSDTAIIELKRRYKKIFICFDSDNAGITDAEKLAQQTGFTKVIPNLGTEKDFSDYWKSLKDKSQFQQLKTLFN